MAAFDGQKSMIRYWLIAFAMTAIGAAVLTKGFLIMTVQKSYWDKVQSRMIYDSLTVDPVRGNILSDKGYRMACNLPEYRMYMDFVALKEGKADTLWHDSLGRDTKTLNELCEGLHRIFPEKSAEEFKAHLKEGYKKDSRYWAIVKRRVDYTTYQRCKKLPIFNLKQGIGGFIGEEFMVRNRPYGSLASSIVGATYNESSKAYAGLELAYDSVLKGHPGFKHRRKVLNGWVDLLDSAAIDGCDIVTTIDVGIQDLAERALKKELDQPNVHGYTGVVIVMETKTGDIKAMVNLDRDSTGVGFHEGRNHAIADWLEPGSVFKTASFLVGLDDNVIDTTMTINTGNGVKDMYGAKMRDHNWHRGGYGTITVAKALNVSSNIGVSALIDRKYHKCPDKFVEGLHRVGIAENLHLPFPEYMPPKVRMPVKDKRGKYSSSVWIDRRGNKKTANWSNTALPWMSIGYETNVPPISVCTFYNAIANDGVMVKPRFVKRIEKDGEVIQEFPVEVLKRQIASEKALKTMQKMLYNVVHVGLGKTAGSKHFDVSGKTGTAQKADGRGYKSGTVNYLLSFCGYFPSEAPEYTCIVCIHKAGLPASGGLMSGQVFHDIAEGIMAKKVKYDAKSSKTFTSVKVPDVKAGNLVAADYVLGRLGFQAKGGWGGAYDDGTPVYGTTKTTTKAVSMQREAISKKKVMPDVHGMGARDAVYLIESRGGKAIVSGCGKVKKQSKPTGEPLHKGEKVYLELK